MTALLNIGLIGFGRMGQGHAQNLAARVRGATLFAVAEPVQELRDLAQSQFAPQHVVASVDDMIALPGLDAVLISTPTSLHCESIVAAASYGKPIFTEKPLGLTLEDCRASVDAAAHAGVPMQVGFMRRFDSGYAEAQRRIAAGEIGTPVMFKGIGRDGQCPRPHFADPKKSGGLIFDMGIHDIDLARFLMGDEVTKVSAMATLMTCPDLAPYGDVDNAVINLSFAGGAVGNIETSRSAFYGFDVRHEVVGTDGMIAVGSYQQMPLVIQRNRGGVITGQASQWDRFSPAYIAQLEHFIDCVRNGKTPSVTGVDGLAASRICVAATLAQHSGRTVELAELE
ncbi:MAG: Gfo/Idh/MocA family oxidoreductase [Chloroflexi bacterium]|nr:Gfo/Idh/MocA family oxidoreductase [Chloroflexota bacterium]